MAKDSQIQKDTSINNFYSCNLTLEFKSDHYSNHYPPICLPGQSFITVKWNGPLAWKDFHCWSKKNRADFVLVCWNAKYSLLWVRMKSFSCYLLVRWETGPLLCTQMQKPAHVSGEFLLMFFSGKSSVSSFLTYLSKQANSTTLIVYKTILFWKNPT